LRKEELVPSSVSSEKRIALSTKNDSAFLSLTVVGVLILVLFTYYSLPIAATPDTVRVSVTTQNLEPGTLNYTAYQLRQSGTALITLSYSFPPTTGSGTLNLTSSWGSVSGTSFTPCSSSNSSDLGILNTNRTSAETRVGTFLPINNCGVYFFPAEAALIYSPNLFTTVTFTVVVTNDSNTGTYLLLPAGGQCGFSIVLIVGAEIHGNLPSLATVNCHYLVPRPSPTISVIGIENLRGLYLTH